ncbi:hypothetical protein [Spirosoma sp.]|uniref:hypothetical protein n=1 Tax=Spirosoma sp. TaxID=1899569 RepID=UPI003B3AE61B
MTCATHLHLYSPFLPPIRFRRGNDQNKPPNPFDEKPRKPDWLVLFMSALFLLTLLIAWLVDIPGLFR